jgi:pimeloyl-ACP methyl ester carboxylesterase
MESELRIQQGGAGDPLLLLVHGLGATSDVWQGWWPLLTRSWLGRWVAPDLPGHGGSAAAPPYTFESLAAAVAEIVDPASPTLVVGHSLGGVVGLVMASSRFLNIRGVVGLGIKVEWADEELARAQALAQRPPAWFATRDEAVARYLRISGLAGLMAEGDGAIDAGIVEHDGKWGLAMEPATFGVGAPDMAGLLANTTAKVLLARGEHDQMNTDEQLRRLGAPTFTLAGLGHNAHVEDPAAVLGLLDRFR